MKPPSARCTVEWPKVLVTAQTTGVTVEVDGVPRHIADIRPVPPQVSLNDPGSSVDIPSDNRTRPPREKRHPLRFTDYEMI